MASQNSLTQSAVAWLLSLSLVTGREEVAATGDTHTTTKCTPASGCDYTTTAATVEAEATQGVTGLRARAWGTFLSLLRRLAK